MNACAAIVDEGVVRGVIATVDCHTKVYAQSGYLALAGSPVFQGAVTALLTIYVAWIGYRLLFAQGSARIADAPIIALKIGLILALVTSWSTFQSLVFDVADRAPLEIAAIVTEPFMEDGGSSLAARPIDGLQAAYEEFSETGAAYGKIAGPNAKGYSSPQAAAAETTAAASGVIFMVSAGTVSAATLAIGVLTAVGPLFIALALIPATRGLFVGWVRALTAAALTPLVAWLLIVLMLAALEPWLATLEAQRIARRMNPQTAMSAAALVFVFAAGQAALVIGACVMAMSFKLPNLGVDRTLRGVEPSRPGQSAAPGLVVPSRAEQLAQHLQRDQVHAAARERAAQTAAAAAAGSGRNLSVSVGETRRLGETYRRPAFTARKAGAIR